MTAIPIENITKYPPESFINSTYINLNLGSNEVDSYVLPSTTTLVASFNGFSFTPNSNLSFVADVDGTQRYAVLDNLYVVKGLNFEENLKFPMVSKASFKIINSTTSAITNYSYRYRVNVFKRSVAMKVMLGLPLSADEQAIADKFGIVEATKLQNPKPFDITSGVSELYTLTISSSASIAAPLTLAPKSGQKLILLGLSAGSSGTLSPGNATLNIKRDEVQLPSLDLASLPSLSYETLMRIVSLNKVEITLNVTDTTKTYYIRVLYGTGKITLKEKIAWGITLSPDEDAVAKAKNLYDEVKAFGVVG